MSILQRSIRVLFANRLSLTALATRDGALEQAKTLVAYYYAVVPFVAYMAFLQNAAAPLRQNFDPLWPLFWTALVPLEYADIVFIVHSLFLLCALFGAVLYRHWAGRLVVFLGVWQLHALESSFGSPNHPWYILLFTSLILVWLPDLWKRARDPETRKTFLLVIWWAQAFVMLVYSMSGFGKLLGLLDQMVQGQIHALSLHAFAYQIADWLPRIQYETPLGAFLIEHVWIAYPIYLVSFFFQLFALWTMVRPSLQRLWAFEMVLFHIGTYLVMGINFMPFIIVLILLFFNTPFGRDATWKETLLDFPIFGPIARLLLRRLFYSP